MIKCTSSSCISLPITDENNVYYKNSGSEDMPLIECQTSGCTAYEGIGNYVNNGDNKNEFPLIQCPSIKSCNYINMPGYYLNAGKDNSSNPLIYCTSNECH